MSGYAGFAGLLPVSLIVYAIYYYFKVYLHNRQLQVEVEKELQASQEEPYDNSTQQQLIDTHGFTFPLAIQLAVLLRRENGKLFERWDLEILPERVYKDNINRGVLKRSMASSNNKVEQAVAVKNVSTIQGQEAPISGDLHEALIMRGLNHPCVLGLVGMSLVYSNGQLRPKILYPVTILESNLHNYLRRRRLHNQVTLARLVHFAIQIAEAISYLEDVGLVHRNLATERCILDENMNVKVYQFAFARKLNAEGYYKADPSRESRPAIGWMAIESLAENIYSTCSDVWSFGVILWEIFSQASTPYGSKSDYEIFEFLNGGGRLERQFESSPDFILEMMTTCWHPNPLLRPRIKGILEDLRVYSQNLPPEPVEVVEIVSLSLISVRN